MSTKIRDVGFLVLLLIVVVVLGFLPKPDKVFPSSTIEEPTTKERSFNSSKRKLLAMYAENRTTFYCGCTYDSNNRINLESCGYQPRRNVSRASRLEWEHIVPASYFGSNLVCWKEGGRQGCGRNSNAFSNFEGDMHNLVPEIGELNGDRSNKIHGNAGWLSRSQYGSCDFRINGDIAEPRDAVKGDVARIWLYMADKYNIQLTSSMRSTFETWNQIDPVDDRERWRNRRIQTIQGDANPYIK